MMAAPVLGRWASGADHQGRASAASAQASARPKSSAWSEPPARAFFAAIARARSARVAGSSFDVAVVGAGCHGLCAAYAARRRGLRVALFERFALGHDRGSSHGTSRITRSSYHDPLYVRLAARAHAEAWPQLERDLQVKALHRTPGLFFGPPSSRWTEFVAATRTAAPAVEQHAVAAARRHFPLFAFPDAVEVLLDPTAAMIAANDVLEGLARWLAARAVVLHCDTVVERIGSREGGVRLHTADGEFDCGGVILAAGAWLPQLAPWLQVVITPLRQQVGYFQLGAPARELVPGRFPVWAWVGPTDNEFFYGLPAFGRPGVKVAQHVTAGAGDPLDPGAVGPAPQRLARVAEFARAQFAVPVLAQVGEETCLYGVAPQERFTIAAAPHDPRIVAVAACSGHGFKFAPLVGQAAVELLLDGVAPGPAFDGASR
jgi:sarcosine oxidase